MKTELKAADGGFCTACSRPLMAGDTEAYVVRVPIDTDGERVRVTALRSDGAVICGTGDAGYEGMAEYTLSADMYSAEGELTLRIAVVGGKSCLTVRELACKVLPPLE